MLTFTYPEEASQQVQDDARAFFRSWRSMMPCNVCSHHWELYLERKPPDVSGRIQLIEWLRLAHNEVNARARPPKPQMSHEEMVQYYHEHFYS